jgi:hypothetical protein
VDPPVGVLEAEGGGHAVFIGAARQSLKTLAGRLVLPTGGLWASATAYVPQLGWEESICFRGTGTTMTISTIADYIELARRERELSAFRRNLHTAIDGGNPTEWMVRRERDVSAERRALHRQIDALRAELWPPPQSAPAQRKRRSWFR